MNTKVSEVENKIPNTSSLVTTTVLKTKIGKVDNKILKAQKHILLLLKNLNQLTAENFKERMKQAYLAKMILIMK